jgi:hypothetical protein
MAQETDSSMKKYGCVPPRYQQGPLTTAVNLGPLAPLAGTWKGSGFNVMWRPDNPASPPFSNTHRYLELNLTSETFNFQVIPGVVPNRGTGNQKDLSLYGLHYLQRVTDADKPPFLTAGQALHIEPGLFMSVPASEEPKVEPTIVRMASIPHGVTLLMQGRTPSTTPKPGAPHIPDVYPIAGMPGFVPQKPPGCAVDLHPPIQGLGIQPVDIPPPGNDGKEHSVPEVSLACDIAGSQSNGPFLPNIPQKYVDNPNVVLKDAIAGQDILGHITIKLSTTEVTDSIANIPFLGTPNPADPTNPTNDPNAFVYSSEATFWIEWVRYERNCDEPLPIRPKDLDPLILGIEPYWPEPTFLQLQYSQISLLIFNQVLWPHINLATLTLSAG